VRGNAVVPHMYRSWKETALSKWPLQQDEGKQARGGQVGHREHKMGEQRWI
jgi:hypothetical protein